MAALAQSLTLAPSPLQGPLPPCQRQEGYDLHGLRRGVGPAAFEPLPRCQRWQEGHAGRELQGRVGPAATGLQQHGLEASGPTSAVHEVADAELDRLLRDLME